MSREPEYLVGGMPQNARPIRIFNDAAVDFLAALSRELMRSPAAKSYPDVVSLAYFIRRANIERLKQPYICELNERLGRGLAFHIAPGNVPINFAYSLVTALLAGNASIVKAPSKDFAQTSIVCDAMRALLEGEYQALISYICVVRYPREAEEITGRLSDKCDARIIWGGDETVRRVREAPIPPRAVEVTFPDRYSLLCLGARAVLSMEENELAKAALGFYNDTYLTDQNACTSPRMVYWLADEDELNEARDRFWTAVHAYASTRYELQPVVAVDKLTEACRAGIELDGAKLEREPDNLITRVSVPELTLNTDSFRSAGGFFIEFIGSDLDALVPVVKSGYQTLSYIGLDQMKLREFVLRNGLTGIDRIVPLGSTMDFSLIWDGCDLIRALSRCVDAV